MPLFDRQLPCLSPLLALGACALAWSATGAPLRAQQASTPATQEQRLSDVEAENARLRRRIDEIAAELERLRGASDAGGAERLRALEAENQELRRRIDLVASEVERVEVGDVIPPVAGSEHGLGPAASKVYQKDQGVTIGGYGELLYENFQNGSDRIDALRTVLYLGYKFDQSWVFNSEIEFEHAGEEVGVEFAYLDYLARPELNWRAGLVLSPMGFLNELHEPTTFSSTHRPDTERFLLPSTWRELGAGAFGDVGPFTYRTYLINAFDAEGFGAAGLRGGRQNGSEAEAEDFAWVGRLDYTGAPGLVAGVSAYWGDTGQDLETAGGDAIDGTTAIVDLHAEYRWRGLRARALWARAEIDDVEELNTAIGLAGDESIGEELEGWYVELGYDVFSAFREDSRQALSPFVRYESLDTQGDVPSGFSSNPANDREIWTFGLAWNPIEQVVVKADYQDRSASGDASLSDVFSISLGFIF